MLRSILPALLALAILAQPAAALEAAAPFVHWRQSPRRLPQDPPQLPRARKCAALPIPGSKAPSPRTPARSFAAAQLTHCALPSALRAGKGAPFPRAQLARFASRVARRDSLNRRWVLRVLEQARKQPYIIDMMSHPAEQVLQWWQYRRIFLTPKRIALGARFWREHRDALERVGAERGVAPRYIVAILGVETYYGRRSGPYRILDALSTLTFDYPPRRRFFGRELEQFLVLAHRDGLDPLTVKGSYAGAMGPMQFMPSTYLRYAVGTGGHPPNLFTNWNDIFASVANYLHAHGWRAGEPVLAPITVEPGATFRVDPHDLALGRTIGGLAAEGARVENDAPAGTPVVLVLAQERTGPAYRAGFHNFRVILTYNDSALYAMAVNDLAQAIAQQMGQPKSVVASGTGQLR